LHTAAPEDHAAIRVYALQLEPDIKCIHRACRKEMADLAGTHYYIDARGAARREPGSSIIDGRCDLPHFTNDASLSRSGFLAHREPGHRLGRIACAPHHLDAFVLYR